MLCLALLALALTGVNNAFLLKRDSVDDALTDLIAICSPTNSTTHERSLDYPCNAYFATVDKCTWNAGPDEGLDYDAEQPAETQRDCFCQSQHIDQVAGCMACYKAHGGVEGEHWYDLDIIESGMSDYCDAEATPTQGYQSMVDDLLTSETPVTATESWTFSDPLADVTEVASYYTPAVTGTAAIPAMPTAESSGGEVSYASVKISDDQVVPTASVDSGARQTAMAFSGAAGAVAVLAAVL